MQFHILNENYTPVAVMDNDLSDAINFNNSKFHRFLTGSADFFDFETSKLHADHNQFQVGYWLAFRYDDRDRLQYINEISEAESDKMMTISSASSNLDLNNETKQPFSATEAKPFKWYFDIIMLDTGYEIGINEISNLTRKLSWENSMTIRAFIQSVATQFDNAELDYEVVLNSDFTIKKRLVHIKKKIGEVRDDIELRYGDNVKTIKRTTSISELCTAVRPVSKDDNDKVVDISSLNDWQELDEKGNVKFFHKKGTNLIFAPQANDRFGNRGHNVTGGGYVVHDFSYDKVSQSELFNRSHIYLKEHSVPAINYEVDGRTGAKIGDTVKIVDDGYTPPLILSARVLEQVFSFDNASVEQAAFGNYKALQSQISTDLIAKMQQLAEENAPYKAVTLTTNGLTFKNSQGNTTLTARLFKGTKEIVPDKFVWYVSDVISDNETNQLIVNADDINVKAVVRWSAVINDITVAFDEVTITDVSDGSDGVDGISPTVTVNPDTSLTIVDAQGTSTTPVLKGNDGIAGKDGTGIKTTVITYAISGSGTTAPSAGWTSSVPSLVKGQYLWTKTVWTYTDNSSETGYSVTYISKDGNNGTDGIAGKDGVGISNTTITYVGSTSGTTAPTSGWTSSVPTVPAGQFLWTKTVWAYTDNTSETGYSVAMMGVKGERGKQIFKSSYESVPHNNGHYWSDLSPAPSIDNPPKIGDTVITPAGNILQIDTVNVGGGGGGGTFGVGDVLGNIKGADGQDGADAWTVIMSNENVTLPANAQGGVTSYTNSGTSISVTYGTGTAFTPVLSSETLANNQFKVSASASNITAGTQTVDTTNKKINYAVASGMNATSVAVASITYTISIRNSAGVTSTVTKVQNFTKAEKGITGDKGIDSYTYIRYSASSNGASMTSLPGADSRYIGTCTTTQATAPTTAGSYVWAKFVGANGAKGDPTGITRSTTEPTTRYKGMLWQYTGTANLAVTGITALPSSLYVWTGSAWQLYLIKSTNLQVDNGFITNAMIGDAQIESAKIKSLDAEKINADNISVMSLNLGDMTGGTVKLMDDVDVNGTLKKHGIYQSKMGLLSSGPSLSTPSTLSNSQMGVANLNKGELRFMVTNYTENLKDVQEAGMSDQNNAFIKFDSYDNGKDVMVIGSSGDIVFKGNTSQETPWITLSSGVKYKYMFSRVYISVDVVGNGSSFMSLGTIPQNYRPIVDQFMIIANWGTGTADDRHIMVRASDGAVILWAPKSGVTYRGEVSYTL